MSSRRAFPNRFKKWNPILRMFFWVGIMVLVALMIVNTNGLGRDLSGLAKFSGINPKVWNHFKRTGFIGEFQTIQVPLEHQDEFNAAIDKYKEKNT